MSNYNARVLTVATHSQGYFEQMVNNDYGIPVEVLGFGKPWTGFTMKFEEVLNRVKELPDDEIVVFLDGFDTIIRGSLDVAVNRFKQMDCKVLFSEHVSPTDSVPDWAVRRIFGTCYKKHIANTGLYMGYAKYIRELLQNVLYSSCKDDQTIINGACRLVDYIKVDTENVIFCNMRNGMEEQTMRETSAVFFQIPGIATWDRYKRGLREYSQFFIVEIFLLFMILAFVFFYFRFDKTGYIIVALFAIYFVWIDKSCISTLIPGVR